MASQVLCHFRNAVSNCKGAENENGAVAIPFALMFVAACAFVGAGVDVSRWLHARHATLAALDAAVLAGGRALQINSTDLAGAVATAKKYYAENVKDRPPVESDTIGFVAADNNTTFRSTGNAYVKTPLLGLINVPTLPVLNENGTEFSKAMLAIGGTTQGDLEIAVMLDTTGSMAGQKAIDMKAAATDLVNIILPDSGSSTHARLSVIPFSVGVRLPSTANVLARGNPPASVKISGGRAYVTPCVVERAGVNRYTDAAPGTGTYVMTLYDPYQTCAEGTQLVPLTNTKSTILAAISALQMSGSTAGQVGTAWAWYMLSPNFKALWPASAAAQYGAAKKIAILMTDGEYNTQYDTSGVDTSYSGKAPANDTSTNQALALCTAMKAKGIEVYTVGFQVDGNATAISTLSTCATDSTKFYNAANGDGLRQAFRDIALKIASLYLTK